MLPPPVCSGTACFRYRAGGDTRSATSCRLAAHATPAREIVKSLLGCVADALTSGLSSLAGLKYFRNFASLSEPRSLTCGHRLAAGWSFPVADGFRDYKSTIIAATTTTVTIAVTPMTSHKVANLPMGFFTVTPGGGAPTSETRKSCHCLALLLES